MAVTDIVTPEVVTPESDDQLYFMCARKHSYPTRKKARLAAMTINAKNRDGIPMGEYRCPKCRWHHVGHNYGKYVKVK